MFIELTDHLRCPADHEEAFLVLLPDQVDGRSVKAGTLGCPVCDRRFSLRDGVFDAGDAPPPPAGATRLTPAALTPLVGLNGPGGYLALVGPPAAGWREVSALIPGVGLVAVNPPDGVADAPGVSVIRAGRLPLKTHSMRGVVLGTPFGSDQAWVREASRVLLPGLRAVGEGADPPSDQIELMASAAGVWVGTHTR